MLNFTVIIWQLYSSVFHFTFLAGKDDESKSRKKKERTVGFFPFLLQVLAMTRLGPLRGL